MTETAHRQHYNVTFTLLAVAAVAYALLQSLVAPALLTIQHDLSTTTSGAAWILTAYLLSASVITPIAGRLGDMFGKKRAMVIVLLVLAAGTLLAALATTIGVMITARVIQGAGGAVFPLSFAIIRDEFPRHRVPHGVALISAILGIGGGLGIVLAGPIVQHLSYHWLFWLPLIAVLIATAGIVAFVPESPVRTPGRVDPLGAVLLAGWLVALLVPISQGPTWGWLSARTLGLFALAAVVLPTWVWVESRSDAPLVDMRMMRLRPVWTTNLAALVIGFGMFASFILVPQFVELPTVDRVRVRRLGHRGRPLHGAGNGRDAGRRPHLGAALDDGGLKGPARARCARVVHRVRHARGRARLELGDLRRDARHGRRDRLRVRVDGEPHHRVCPGPADGRRDRHEHDRPQHRRCDRKPGVGRDRDSHR